MQKTWLDIARDFFSEAAPMLSASEIDTATAAGGGRRVALELEFWIQLSNAP